MLIYRYKKQICMWAMLVLTLAVVAFIFSNSVKSAPESSAQSDKVVDAVRPPAEVLLPIVNIEPSRAIIVEIVRTVAHGAEFALLGCLAFWTARLWLCNKWFRLVIPFVFCTLTAITDETIQLFSPGRAWQLGDLLIDCAGAVCGMLFAFLCLLSAHAVAKKRAGVKKTVNNL